MKKILILVFTIFSLGLTSCDMDVTPYDSIPTDEALTSITGFEGARVGLYSSYLGLAGGSYVLTPEIQCDAFNAVADFSNTYGDIYRWTFESSNSTIESIWAKCYFTIARANFLIDGVENVDNNSEIELTDTQKEQINVYKGEAYFTRAYCYLYLASMFCEDYDVATASYYKGLPLQLKYTPKNKPSEYPGRSSLEDTYKQILSDLNEAKECIETANSKEGIVDYDRYVNGAYVTINTSPKNRGNYITTDVVTALQARLALQMDNYNDAVKYADELINSNRYPLMSNAEDFKDMWKNDTGTETIWQIAMKSSDDAGMPLGTIFIGNPSSKKDYIPTQSLIDLYSADDIRLSTYFGKYHLSVSSGNAADIYFFNKYPGNDYYNSLESSTRFLNQPKPLRIAEMYLISAEANAKIGTSISLQKAKEKLQTLKEARIPGVVVGDYNKEDMMNEIMDERERELVGEGFRLMDLKRWKKSVIRGNSQNSGLILFPGQQNTDKLNRLSNDVRMVWPIPKSEIDSNPQLKNQQNPGY